MSKADTLLKRAISFERLAIYSDRKSFLQALSQSNTEWSQEEINQSKNEQTDPLGRQIQPGIPAPPASKNPEPVKQVHEIPTVNITGQPPIRRSQKEALSRVVTVDGIGMPIKADGILGPETQKAIDAFKKKFDPQSKYKLTNQKVLDWAEMLSNEPKYKS
jgi:hypothetical protein